MTRAAPAQRQRQQAQAAQQAMKQLYDALNPQLRKFLTNEFSEIQERRQETLEYYHAQGYRWGELKRNPDKYLTKAQKDEGQDPLELAGRVWQAGFATILKAIRFADVYNKAEFARLIGLRSDADPNFRLHWGHVIHLMSARNADERRRFEDRAVEHCWTPEMLHGEMKKLHGGARRSGGRPFVIPNGVNAQVKQIRAVTGKWLKGQDNVWNGEQHSVFTNLLSVPPDKVTPDLLEEVQQLRVETQQLQQAAKTDEDLCSRIIAHYEECLRPKAAEPAPVESTADMARARRRPSA